MDRRNGKESEELDNRWKNFRGESLRESLSTSGSGGQPLFSRREHRIGPYSVPIGTGRYSSASNTGRSPHMPSTSNNSMAVRYSPYASPRRDQPLRTYDSDRPSPRVPPSLRTMNPHISQYFNSPPSSRESQSSQSSSGYASTPRESNIYPNFLSGIPPSRSTTSLDRPYQRRHDFQLEEVASFNPGVRGDQVFDETGRQHTYHAKRRVQSAPEPRQPKKVYASNELEYNNPTLALKYTKPYDAFEKFYQFVIDRPPNPFEQKVIRLLDEVFSQPGVRSKLIFLESEEDKPLQTLQSSVDCCKSTLVLDMDEDGDHVLLIDGEEICRGKYQNKQIAKNALGEIALQELSRSCFYIIKKPDVYEDVSTDQKTIVEQGPGLSQYATPGSKAYEMLKKMGWTGKGGLGVKEQGESRPVSEIIDQNVTKRGFGSRVSKNKGALYREIQNIFDDFKRSAKISILRFAPDFDKEERAFIHTLALKAGLKSKSEGVAPNRRITVTQKLSREELVHNLLLIGCESALYELLIPEKFAHIWANPQAGF